ncbi:hypothetical protein OG455_05215 [Kitasatospora sp. NBC_01287]|uniref:hypothetical protein n=1 Tax=Kitasatospora sp. NBC_01287 TaxID=2903573 RepID=UPI00225AFBA3|nr:hypothetical protein [Kitasatospora sp. NBC_01287]MCX4744926.1 hypothetical protein [Kitasatospora sp. NBC_01287]
MRGAVMELAVWWVVLVTLTLGLIGPATPVELVAAVLAATAAAGAARRVRRAAGRRPGVGPGVPRALAVLPYALLRGCALLVRALARAERPQGVRRPRPEVAPRRVERALCRVDEAA